MSWRKWSTLGSEEMVAPPRRAEERSTAESSYLPKFRASTESWDLSYFGAISITQSRQRRASKSAHRGWTEGRAPPRLPTSSNPKTPPVAAGTRRRSSSPAETRRTTGAMGRKGMEFAIAVPETLPFSDKILSPPQQPTTSSGRPTLTKQASQRTMNCLCSPTTHVGSFRCRHHRNTSHLRSTASVGSGLSAYGGEEGGSGGGAFSPKLADLGDKVASGGASVRV